MSSERRGPRRRVAEQWSLLTPADRLLILLVAGAAVALFSVQHGIGEGTAAAVVVQGQGRTVYPVGPVRMVEVAGPLGMTLVELGPAGARVAASPCANQMCVRQGWVRRAGGVVACVPNRVVVSVAGDEAAGAPDAVSR